MSGFSEDCQWWWDGAQWVATSKVVLPDLPMTEFEQWGKLKEVGTRAKAIKRLDSVNSIALLNSIYPLARALEVPLVVMLPGVLSHYRSWRLEQLTLATALLLGPDEPMVAAEPATLAIFPEDYPTGSLAVVVTNAHVVVFRIDVDSPAQGQPRWIALASRPSGVKMEFQKRLMGLAPGLTISDGNRLWTIRGLPGLIKPEPVLDAWRQGAKSAARA